jgi:phage terminase large subunit-like protein
LSSRRRKTTTTRECSRKVPQTEPAKLAVKFFEENLTHSKGELGGQRFLLEPWQKDYLKRLFGTLRKDGLRKYRTSLLALPRKNGKALALDTPVLTTNGWSTMGDLRVGDHVFHPHGYPVRVIAATPVLHGRQCYAVKFTHGDTIVADADHLWRTRALVHAPGSGIGNHGCLDRRAGWGIRTTRQIAETLKSSGENNHSVDVCEAVDLPQQPLPIDPYVLGCWLGDGHTSAARITCAIRDEELLRNIEATGVPVTRTRYPSKPNVYTAGLRGGMQATLRREGLLGQKHIPDAYMQASASQRLSLLQGLMDTDGTISKAGRCTFVSIKKHLATQVRDLAVSLGLKTSFSTKPAKINGRFICDSYLIAFTPQLPMRVFRLSRKQARVREAAGRLARSRSRQIESCEPISSVPVRCIQVAAMDGMFVVGRSLIPTHNSTLCAGIALRLLFDGEPGAEIYSCAADRDQARLVFEMAKVCVEQSPKLKSKLKVYRNSIVREDTHSFYKALSAEAFTKHGLNAHGVIFDELHAQPDRELVDVMQTSMGARRQPMLVYITTAGYDRKSVCWEIWKYAEAVASGAIKDESFLPMIYAAATEDDWRDEKTWQKANPNLGVSVKLDFLRTECARAVEMPSYENTFRQLHLNQWTEQDTRWLRMDHWAQGNAPCPVSLAGRECWAGLDLATTFDTTALVLLFPLDEGRYWVEPHFWIPEENMRDRVRRDKVSYDVWARQGHLHLTPGNVTDFDQVRSDINELAKKYAIKQVAIDRWNATQLANQLQGDGVNVIGFGQGYSSMSGPSLVLESLCVSGKLLHGGHPTLAWQAGNVAVQRDHNGNIKPSKAKSNERIDGIVALVMALGIHASQTVRGPAVEPSILLL